MGIFKKEKEQPIEVTPKDLVKKIQALGEDIEKIAQELKEVKKKSKHIISKIGITRFNPFKEIGGNQSFAIAMLDEKHDGIIITSYYGRDLNRMYAKEVKGGVSEYKLSQEEKEAIAQAIGLENQDNEAPFDSAPLHEGRGSREQGKQIPKQAHMPKSPKK